MTRLILLTTALLSIFACDIALAQQQGRPDNAAPGQRPGSVTRPAPGRPGGGRPGNPGNGGPQRPGRPMPPRPGDGGPQIQPPRPGRPTPPRPGNGGPGYGGPQIQPPRPGGPTPSRPQPSRPGRPQRPTPPHRPGSGRPPNFRPVHGRPFRYPYGYAYRRWTIGLLLPSLFLSSAYYYDDYADLGVGPPAPGYRWVRYGPDLLMVSVHTGRIGDVIYGAFY